MNVLVGFVLCATLIYQVYAGTVPVKSVSKVSKHGSHHGYTSKPTESTSTISTEAVKDIEVEASTEENTAITIAVESSSVSEIEVATVKVEETTTSFLEVDATTIKVDDSIDIRFNSTADASIFGQTNTEIETTNVQEENSSNSTVEISTEDKGKSQTTVTESASTEIVTKAEVPVEKERPIEKERPVEKVHKHVTENKPKHHEFDTKAAAEVLHKALFYSPVNTKAIITVLTHATNSQRLDIAAVYRDLYKMDLVLEFTHKLHGEFQHLVLSLMTPLIKFYAMELHDAMAGVGTNENSLMEILTTISNEEMKKLHTVYKHAYDSTLDYDIHCDTSGYFEKLLTTITSGARDESDFVDELAAKHDATALLQAGELKWGTDEDIFITILTHRNFKQLGLIFKIYEGLTGHSIEHAIETEFSSHIKRGLLDVVSIARNAPNFFAERLHESMADITDLKTLTRIIVLRSEIDLDLIKLYYAINYKTSLFEDVMKKTSGDFKACLMSIIGKY